MALQGIAKGLGGVFQGAIPALASTLDQRKAAKASNQARQRTLNRVTGLINGPDSELLFGEDADDVFGTKPQILPGERFALDASRTDPGPAPEFQGYYDQDPGFQNTAARVAKGNLANVDLFSQLAAAINDSLRAEVGENMDFLDPSFRGNLKQQGENNTRFLKGVMPFSDVQDASARGAETAALTGNPLNGRAITARDIGTSRLSLMQQGNQGQGQLAQILSTFLPTNLTARPDSYMVDTNGAISLAAGDNRFKAGFDQDNYQFGANFDLTEKGQYNQTMKTLGLTDAMADPAVAGLFNLRSKLRGMELGLESTPPVQAPSFGAAFLSSLAQNGFGNNGGNGGFGSQTSVAPIFKRQPYASVSPA